MQILLLLLLLLTVPPSYAVVNVPGVEFNVATGQAAHASSYYDYAPNPVRDTVFRPENAIDGFADESSWWSSGEEVNVTTSGSVFWQLNLTAAPPTLARIVLRWHGFLTPVSYKVRVSLLGENFRTIAVVTDKPIAYDRVDVITAGLDKVDTRFRFVRVAIDAPNVCADSLSCAADGSVAALGTTNERLIYGIREFELWAKGVKNGAGRTGSSQGLQWLVALLVVLRASEVV